MRKISTILVTAVLAAALGNVYAATDNPCPDLTTLRDSGSKFTTAFHEGKGSANPDLWILSSTPFFFGGETWQTVFATNMPGIDDPQTALEKGKNDYHYYSLMTTPNVFVSGKLISCGYSPPGGNYLVYADNQSLVGRKKFM